MSGGDSPAFRRAEAVGQRIHDCVDVEKERITRDATSGKIGPIEVLMDAGAIAGALSTELAAVFAMIRGIRASGAVPVDEVDAMLAAIKADAESMAISQDRETQAVVRKMRGGSR